MPASKPLLLALLGSISLTVGVAVATNTPANPGAAAPAPAAATEPSTQKSREQRKQEDTERVLKFFEETQPDMYEKARSLRQSDPANFDKLIHGALGTVNHLEDLRKKNPRLFALKMQDLKLAYRSLAVANELKRPDLSPAEKTQLTKDLTDTVSNEFDVYQQIRQAEIDDLMKRIADLQTQLEQQAHDKDDVIKKRVDDLQTKPPSLQW